MPKSLAAGMKPQPISVALEPELRSAVIECKFGKRLPSEAEVIRRALRKYLREEGFLPPASEGEPPAA